MASFERRVQFPQGDGVGGRLCLAKAQVGGGEGQRRSRGPGRSWPDPVPGWLWGTGREAARHRCRRRAREATPASPVGSPGRSIAGGGHGLQQ